MSSGVELANQIDAVVQQVQRVAHAVHRKQPQYGPVLDEIERLAGEIAQDCAAGPIVTGAAPSESPRVDEHAASQASLTGEGYHEADLVQAGSFERQSDVSEYTLAEKGIAAAAFEHGLTAADVMTTDAGRYEEALEKTGATREAIPSPHTGSVADVAAGVEQLLRLYRGPAGMTAEATRRITGLEAAIRQLRDTRSG